MTSMSLKELNKLPVRLASGHRLCAGCAESIIAKQILMSASSKPMTENDPCSS